MADSVSETGKNYAVKNGWFHEKVLFGNTLAPKLKIKEILYHKPSKFQDIMVLKSESMGNVLVLDGCIQCTEFDEFAYHEMISFLPLNSHSNPRKVLVIGAGDGGVLREVLKHPDVHEVTLCEIDEEVINVSKQYLPSLAKGFEDKRVSVQIGDGFKFLDDHKNAYDVIICDLSDPEETGLSSMLFSSAGLCKLKSCLKPDGIGCLQSESMWMNTELISGWIKSAKTLFSDVKYASIYIPTYPGGQIGFLLFTNDQNHKLGSPIKNLNPENFGFKYYSNDIHTASFILPQIFQKAFN